MLNKKKSNYSKNKSKKSFKMQYKISLFNKFLFKSNKKLTFKPIIKLKKLLKVSYHNLFKHKNIHLSFHKLQRLL